MTLKNTNKQIIEYAVANLKILQNLALFFDKENSYSYCNSVGGHLRHIIEHYEALAFKKSSQINYDLRERDEFLEKNPAEAVERIEIVIKRLYKCTSLEIELTIDVDCVGGIHGEYIFSSQSTVGRELCFLNSHCIHHLAIIKPICKQFAIPLDKYFGFAPSTIAYLESQKLEA